MSSAGRKNRETTLMPIKAQTEVRKRNSIVKDFTKNSPLSTPTKHKQMKIDKFVRNSPLKTETLEIKSENNPVDDWNINSSDPSISTHSEVKTKISQSPQQNLYAIAERKQDHEYLIINSQDSNFSEGSDIVILNSNSTEDNPARTKVSKTGKLLIL